MANAAHIMDIGKKTTTPHGVPVLLFLFATLAPTLDTNTWASFMLTVANSTAAIAKSTAELAATRATEIARSRRTAEQQ